jgi:hypothetical protein
MEGRGGEGRGGEGGEAKEREGKGRESSTNTCYNMDKLQKLAE